MKTVIGITGEKGSGKEMVGDLIASHFKNKKVAKVRSSDILRETLKIWNITPNRHNLQHIAIVMNNGFGLGTLSNAVKARIDSIDADIIIFDGIRWDSDAELLHSFPKNFLIYVTASAKIRFKRTTLRKEKVGEESVTFKQFMKEEKAQTELRIPVLGKKADLILKNEGEVGEIKKILIAFLKRI